MKQKLSYVRFLGPQTWWKLIPYDLHWSIDQVQWKLIQPPVIKMLVPHELGRFKVINPQVPSSGHRVPNYLVKI